MSSYVEIADRINLRLSQLGVVVNPGSRFGQMIATMRNGFVGVDDPRFPAAREAIRDLLVLDFVLMNQSARISDDEYTQHLSRIVDDPVDPLAGKKGTPGRNFQHEMYIAAICTAAGLDPVFAEPPDVMGDHVGETVGFAAKRMRSINRFEDHCKDARKQIADSGRPGWIVCDVTHAIEKGEFMIPVEIDDATIFRAWSASRRAFVDRMKDKGLFDWFVGTDVRAIVLVEHFLKAEAVSECSLASYTLFVNLHPNHKIKTFEFESLKGMWREALPN